MLVVAVRGSPWPVTGPARPQATARGCGPGTTGAPVSGAGGCAQIRPELGVYVLGAITPAGRAVVGRHLMSCPRCRDEVAGLAGIPAMLRRVPAAAAELSGQRPGGDGPGPQAVLLDGLLRRVAAARRQRRWRLAAAAVLAAAAAAGWVPQLLHAAAPPRQATAAWWTAAASGFDPATRAGATRALRARVLGHRAGSRHHRHRVRDRLPDLGHHRHVDAKPGLTTLLSRFRGHLSEGRPGPSAAQPCSHRV